MRGRALVVASVLAGALLSGCDDDGAGAPVSDVSSTTPDSAATPTSLPVPQGPPAVALEEIGRFDEPLHVAFAPGDTTPYVVEKGGRVRAARPAGAATVLDIRDLVATGSEQGLLGLAFSPREPFAYVNYTDRAGDTHVAEVRFEGGAFDRDTLRDVLTVDQPFSNHNGGNLLFGPDGMLYIGLGDGGSGGDPQGYAQRMDTLLGKLLRIDPSGRDGGAYGIPADNPFAGQRGVRPEIWASGLRNPWRFTFDRETGDLWVGDVGQNAREEVNRVDADAAAGADFAWNRREGTASFDGGQPEPGDIEPVHDYPRAGGACAVTGGYVYRGGAMPALRGTYLFADFCEGTIRTLRPPSWTPGTLPLQVPALAGFGEDADGELYVASLEGAVSKLVPA